MRAKVKFDGVRPTSAAHRRRPLPIWELPPTRTQSLNG